MSCIMIVVHFFKKKIRVQESDTSKSGEEI